MKDGIDSPAELDAKRVKVKIAPDFADSEVLVDGEPLPVFWIELSQEAPGYAYLKMGVAGRHFHEVEVEGTLYVKGVINREAH